jgi:hypothetical protein
MEAKRQRKKNKMAQPGAQSNYAKKKIWLHRHNLWGFEVPSPKPW